MVAVRVNPQVVEGWRGEGHSGGKYKVGRRRGAYLKSWILNDLKLPFLNFISFICCSTPYNYINLFHCAYATHDISIQAVCRMFDP